MGNCVSSEVIVEPGLDPDVGISHLRPVVEGRLLPAPEVACGSSVCCNFAL